jgi:hypothetical protein
MKEDREITIYMSLMVSGYVISIIIYGLSIFGILIEFWLALLMFSPIFIIVSGIFLFNRIEEKKETKINKKMFFNFCDNILTFNFNDGIREIFLYLYDNSINNYLMDMGDELKRRINLNVDIVKNTEICIKKIREYMKTTGYNHYNTYDIIDIHINKALHFLELIRYNYPERKCSNKNCDYMMKFGDFKDNAVTTNIDLTTLVNLWNDEKIIQILCCHCLSRMKRGEKICLE